MKGKGWLVVGGLMLLVMGGCATTSAPPAATGNPGQLVDQLEADLAAARTEQVNVLAPGLFNDAQSAFVKAKQGLEKGAKLSAINDYVADGNASLAKAREIAQVSRTILGQTNAARDKALAAGADRLGEPFMKVEEKYLKLTKAIENDNLSYAQKHAAEVQADFREVEIMAIKADAIGQARQMMAAADKADLNKIAPKTYADARQALTAADDYIGRNPYEKETIQRMAAHAEFMGRRLMTVGDRAEMLAKTTPEDAALWVEGLLAGMSDNLNAGDLRDLSADDQVARLNADVKALQDRAQTLEKERQTYAARAANLEQEVSGLKGYSQEQEAAKQKLAAEREFNEKFNRVQRYFRPDEAEVYKQGGQLVIRLRGIQFPVGQATLAPENYTLLSKVQQAIQTFGQPMVTVEGHTDSTGSAEKNQALSQQRADAVKTYLVANRTLPEGRIRATGYGPDRPLAPNTTPEGRAVNRRIDVLITPVQ